MRDSIGGQGDVASSLNEEAPFLGAYKQASLFQQGPENLACIVFSFAGLPTSTSGNLKHEC